MSPFFSRERFGEPQIIAGCLLLFFLAQCFWLVNRHAQRREIDSTELFRIERGLRLWHAKGFDAAAYAAMEHIPGAEAAGSIPDYLAADGYDPHHSQLWYLIAAAPLLGWPAPTQPETLPYLNWLAPIPYLVFGMLLGASLWYVARRLYGNAGGYIALALYCFSPGIIRAAALWSAEPELGAAWGAFGAIFTAIAVSHTLYAPREVVLWNWRRTILLALSLALAMGTQFSLVVVVPLALGFMLYLAPTRRGAALAIFLAASAMGSILLLAACSFQPSVLWQGLLHAEFFPVTWRAFRMFGAYRQVIAQSGQISPALLLIVPASLVTYTAWARTRYFGNSAPLLVGGIFIVLAIATPHYPGLGFLLMAAPFLFVFVAGICADLLETSYRPFVMACVWGLLAASALWNLMELARVP
jgi:hypothetical protein